MKVWTPLLLSLYPRGKINDGKGLDVFKEENLMVSYHVVV